MKSAEDALFLLQIAHSVKDVATALELDAAKFFFVIQNADSGIYYRQFNIPKRSGGFRNISAPRKGLALAQDRLSQVLAFRYNPKQYVRGYVKGQSFLTNAQYHERQRWVLNLDIADFFPSIGFPRVRGLFMSPYFGFNDRVATILARITTFNNQLPQGASTSPILANIIAHSLDQELYKLAIREGISYTRYADDITFSSSKKSIPSSIVAGWEPLNGQRSIRLGHDVTSAFHKARFTINHAKVRIQFPSERQEVTGLGSEPIDHLLAA